MLTGSSFADDIRYLSLHDNSYLRYFKGHKKKCVLALPLFRITAGADGFSGGAGSFRSPCRRKTIRFFRPRATTLYGYGTCERRARR